MVTSPIGVKYVLFVSAGALAVFGLVLFILAIFDSVSAGKAAVKISAAKEFYFNIGLATFTIVILPLAWYGGAASNKYILGTYLALIFIVAVVGIASMRILITIDNQIDEPTLIRELRGLYLNYATDPKVRDSIDVMQKHYLCCGPDKAIKIGDSFPVSCCKVIENGKCTYPSPQSCAYAITKTVQAHLKTEATLGIVFGCIAGVSCLAAFSSLGTITNK